VRSLIEAPQPSGVHSVFWDGTDQRGQAVGTGAYFYRLSAAGQVTTRAVLVVR